MSGSALCNHEFNANAFNNWISNAIFGYTKNIGYNITANHIKKYGFITLLIQIHEENNHHELENPIKVKGVWFYHILDPRWWGIILFLWQLCIAVIIFWSGKNWKVSSIHILIGCLRLTSARAGLAGNTNFPLVHLNILHFTEDRQEYGTQIPLKLSALLLAITEVRECSH